jgi:peptide subunit release factor RF-3
MKKQHLQKNSYYLVVLKTGAVKNNNQKGATGDFMEIERQRGISVSTSVLAFILKKKNKHSYYSGHKVRRRYL